VTLFGLALAGHYLDEPDSARPPSPEVVVDTPAVRRAARDSLLQHIAQLDTTLLILRQGLEQAGRVDQYDLLAEAYATLQRAESSVPRVPRSAPVERELAARYRRGITSIRYGVRSARRGVEEGRVEDFSEARAEIADGTAAVDAARHELEALGT
jgi:hypothetical protein